MPINSDKLNEWRATRTPEQLHEQAVAAGRASGAARRRRADLQHVCECILGKRVSDESARALLRLYGFDADDSTVAEGIAVVMAAKALQGDRDAAVYVRDTAGQAPTHRQALALERPGAGADMRLLATEELERLLEENE